MEHKFRLQIKFFSNMKQESTKRHQLKQKLKEVSVLL